MPTTFPPPRDSMRPSLVPKADGLRPSRAPKKKTVGRPQGRFTQHRRIDRLRELLESEPRGLTLEELASTLRITQRSVRRYLRELDGVTELESIETTPGGAHLWRIKPSERGRAVPLRRAQAYAILATRRALEVLKGSALYDEIDIALGQIEQVAKTPFRTSGKTEISGERDLESRFFWLPPTSRSYAARGEDLDELFRAVADLRVLRYRLKVAPKASSSQPRADRLAFLPFALVVHEGTIKVIGTPVDPTRSLLRAHTTQAKEDEIEILSFDATTELHASETEQFTLPPTFDVNAYVHGEFGLGRPSKTRAIVEFDARVADEIRAKKLHREQKLATSPDGRVRISLPRVNDDALVRWVLSFGDAARIVEPVELVRRVADVLDRARLRYRS